MRSFANAAPPDKQRTAGDGDAPGRSRAILAWYRRGRSANRERRRMATKKGAPTTSKRIKSMSIDIVRTVDGAVIFFIDGAKASAAAVRKVMNAALPPQRKAAPRKKPARPAPAATGAD